MTDYNNWKIEKSIINYTGDDEEKQQEAQAAQNEYSQVAEWCNENQQYTIEDDGIYYKVVEIIIPEPTPPTDEEIKRLRVLYRREHIDDQTAERSRKMANGTWTNEDEVAYLALDAEVTAYIEEHYPYNE